MKRLNPIHSKQDASSSAAKRPRLSPESNKDDTRLPHLDVSNGEQRIAPSIHDESAFMDDLMSGLDASFFNLDSSPIKSQNAIRNSTPKLSQRSQHSVSSQSNVNKEVLSPKKAKGPLPGLRVKKGPLSPSKTRQTPAKRLNDSSPTVKSELPYDLFENRLGANIAQMADQRSGILPAAVASLPPNFVELELKSDPFDDALFEFDFGLVDLLAFDENVVSHPAVDAVHYPILHPTVPPPPLGYQPTPWARYTVVAVFNGLAFGDGVMPVNLEDDRPFIPSTSTGKTVVVKMKGPEERRVLHLKDRWADLPLRKNDIINVISSQLSSSNATAMPIVITFKDPSSFIILHPDIMLTMTSIANAMPCPRKPILQSLVKIPAPSSKPMLYGTILHGLLQGALQEQKFDIDETRRRLDEELGKEERRLEVWGAGLGLEDVKLEVRSKAGQGFETFGRKWVGATPKLEGDLHAQTGQTPSRMAITGLHDIEEDIWSPKWGLKGKVDASVQASIQKPGEHSPEENIAPLEIKTGRMIGVMAHRAQTMLYTLLMEDRYGVPVPAGLLYYSQLDSVLRVEARANEIRALIIARNELAHYLAKQRIAPLRQLLSYTHVDIEDTAFLPPTIDNPRECRSCYSVDSCMLYRKAFDNVQPSEDDPIAELYVEKTGQMSEKDAAFFKKWDTLLTIEEQEIGRFRSQLWTMTSEKREKNGRCFSDMVISSYSNDIGKSLAKIHRHSYTFVRSPHLASQRVRPSLLSGHTTKGDPVTLSIEPDLLCLSRGFVTDLTPETITIGVTYVIDTEALLARTKHRGHAMDGDRVMFRIDKDEMAAGMMKMRANLAQLFFTGGSESLRRLVVDLEMPTFEDARLPKPEEIPPSFNADQRTAMEKVMCANDYALILGMPGTGKTTTIAEIIKALVERGKSVLLTSYTHSAVDTILMKLVNAEFDMLRLGNIDKVHPDVQHLTLEALQASTNMAQLEARLMGPPVVAATCLSVDHPLFLRRKFDYCIVDEASQITLPTCLGPLRLADQFVLVGDHFQLPPIVRNVEAKRGGLDVSLFRLLSEANPSAVIDLSHQYRMNEDIMLLSNRLVYENRLKCGSETVARQSLVLSRRSACGELFEQSCDEKCWIQDLLDDDVKAMFVDTDGVPALDSKVGSLVQNEPEAKLVYQLAHALTGSGLNQSDLAIITPYRQQIKLLTGMFISLPRVEILTADKSQGRDKECILISLVRSNLEGFIGDLLKDWRRINVSFTRAKRKLVIFGSKRTLQSDGPLSGFLELMEEKNWVYTLPNGAAKIHSIPVVGSVAKLENGNVDDAQDEKIVKGRGTLSETMMEKKPFIKEVFADFK